MMKTFALFPLLLLVLLAACLPLPRLEPAEAPSTVYDATPEALLAAIADVGPTLEPGPPFPAYAITMRTAEMISLSANLHDGEHSFISIRTEALEEGTRLRISSGGPGSPAALRTLLEALDGRFNRLPA